ncbi:MAG: GPI inositol deacylase [Watsoniomyces obsoletus]|nr:MAG: GPI inositol deacylase [Watsoniomyces obsoletus]
MPISKNSLQAPSCFAPISSISSSLSARLSSQHVAERLAFSNEKLNSQSLRGRRRRAGTLGTFPLAARSSAHDTEAPRGIRSSFQSSVLVGAPWTHEQKGSEVGQPAAGKIEMVALHAPGLER